MEKTNLKIKNFNKLQIKCKMLLIKVKIFTIPLIWSILIILCKKILMLMAKKYNRQYYKLIKILLEINQLNKKMIILKKMIFKIIMKLLKLNKY